MVHLTVIPGCNESAEVGANNDRDISENTKKVLPITDLEAKVHAERLLRQSFPDCDDKHIECWTNGIVTYARSDKYTVAVYTHLESPFSRLKYEHDTSEFEEVLEGEGIDIHKRYAYIAYKDIK